MSPGLTCRSGGCLGFAEVSLPSFLVINQATELKESPIRSSAKRSAPTAGLHNTTFSDQPISLANQRISDCKVHSVAPLMKHTNSQLILHHNNEKAVNDGKHLV